MPRPEKWKQLPSKERLDSLLSYNPESGELRWKGREFDSLDHDGNFVGLGSKRWNAIFKGKEAGSRRPGFYRKVTIDGSAYMAHRLIWKIVHNEEPISIDHINGDIHDNRISNLRSVEMPVNLRNKSLYENNKSGFPGVEFHNRDLVWVAKIGAGNKQIHLGTFPTKDEAIACRIGAEVVLAYHANHGRQKYEE